MVSVDIGSSNACVRVERSKLAKLLSTAHREQAVIRHKSIGVALHALNTEQKRVWGQRKIWPGPLLRIRLGNPASTTYSFALRRMCGSAKAASCSVSLSPPPGHPAKCVKTKNWILWSSLRCRIFALTVGKLDRLKNMALLRRIRQSRHDI